MRVLVLAAHPDDEVIGCGGTIAAHVEAGDEVGVLYFTQGRAGSVIANDAAALLGFTVCGVVGYADQRLDMTALSHLADDVSTRLLGVSRVYTHWREDVNQDHVAVSRATDIACRHIHTVLYYESEGSRNFEPNWFQKIDFEVKNRALECYASEMRPPPHPRSRRMLGFKASVRGSQCGHNEAEAFIVGRHVHAHR